MDRFSETNRALWDEWARIHATSEFYDVPGFKAGAGTLWPDEIEAIGDVRGKSLLHLQCHFGMDTLSWARRGARVTGVDFSSEAIEIARTLAKDVGIDARFIESDVLGLDDVLDEEFDLVYTGRGAIYWLGDLARWGRIVARCLARGGMFYMHEFHPFFYVFDDDEPVLRYPYFPTAEPQEFPVKGSYADRDAEVSQTIHYGWPHSLEEIFSALLDPGLTIRRFREFDYTEHRLLEWLVQNEDGRWRAPDRNVPLMFSILATKE